MPASLQKISDNRSCFAVTDPATADHFESEIRRRSVPCLLIFQVLWGAGDHETDLLGDPLRPCASLH
jgi:hypothetical protein